MESVEKYEESKVPNLSKTRIDGDGTIADNFNSQFDLASQEDEDRFDIKEQIVKGHGNAYNLMGDTEMSSL